MRESDPDDSAQDASPRKKKGLYSHSPMDILSDIRKKHGRQKGIHADEKQHSISQPEDKQFGHEERSLSDYFPPEEEENNEFKPIEVREILPREKEEELPESPSIRQKVESILKSPKRVVIEKTPSKMTEYGTNSLESYDLSAKDFGEKEEQETRNEDYDYAKPGKQKGEFEEISGADSYDNKADEEDEFDAEESEDKEKTIHDYDLDEDDFEPRVRDALSEFEERKLENFEAEQKIENLPPPPMLPKAGKGRRMRAAPSKKYSDEEGKSKKSIENYGLSKEDFESEGEFDKGRLGKERKEFEDSSQSGEEFGEEEEKTLHDYDLDEKDFEKQDSARLFSSLSKEEAKTPVKLQVTEIGAPTIEAEQIPKELQDELRHPLFAEKSQEITDKEEEFLEEASDWENLHSPQEAQEPPVPQEAEFEGEEQFAGREPLSHPSRVQMHLVKKGGGGLFASRPKMLNMNTAIYVEDAQERLPTMHQAGSMAHIKKSGAGIFEVFSKKPSEAGQLQSIFEQPATHPPVQKQKIYKETSLQKEKAHEKDKLPQIFQPLHINMPKVRKSGTFNIFASKPKQAGALGAHAKISKQKKKEKKPSLYCPSMHEVKKSQALPFFSPAPKMQSTHLRFYQPKKRKKAETHKLSLSKGHMHLVKKSGGLAIFSPSPKMQKTHLDAIIKKEKKKIFLPKPHPMQMHQVHSHLPGQIPFFAKEPTHAGHLHEIKLEQKKEEQIAKPHMVKMHNAAHPNLLHIFEKKPAHAPSNLKQMPLTKPIPLEVIREKQDTEKKEKLIEEFFTNSPHPQGKTELVQKKFRTPLHPVHVKMSKRPSPGLALFHPSQKPDAYRDKFNLLHVDEEPHEEVSGHSLFEGILHPAKHVQKEAQEKKQHELLQVQKEAQERKQHELLQERKQHELLQERKQHELLQERKQHELLQVQKEAQERKQHELLQEKKQHELLQERMREQKEAQEKKQHELLQEKKQHELLQEKKQHELLQVQKEAQEKKQHEKMHTHKESRHKMFAGLFSPSRKHSEVEDFSHVAKPRNKEPTRPPSRTSMRQVPKYLQGFSIFKSGPHPSEHREKFSQIKIEQLPKRQLRQFYRPQATRMQKISNYSNGFRIFSGSQKPDAQRHSFTLISVPEMKKQKERHEPYAEQMHKISAYTEGFSLFGKEKKPAAQHMHLKETIEEIEKPQAEEIKEVTISQIHEKPTKNEKKEKMKIHTNVYAEENEILPPQQPSPLEKDAPHGFGDFLKGMEIGKPSTDSPQASPLIMRKKGAKISQPGIMGGQRASMPSTVLMPSTKGLSKSEWNMQYRSELSRPVPTQAQVDSYYESSPVEQKKYLHALLVEEAYWKYANSPKSSKKHGEAQQKFMSMLESSSPEQRVSIEQGINLTKAVSAVSVFTNPNISSSQREEAHSIYNNIIGQHHDLRPLVQYQVARLALMKAHNKDSFSPPAQYSQFIQLLDKDLQECVYAMRAAFLDRIMNNKGASQLLREWAAKYYSQILLAMPQISKKLGVCLTVHRGFELFFASQAASTLEEERILSEKWQRLANEDEDVRLIIFYELATIFYGKLRGGREEE